VYDLGFSGMPLTFDNKQKGDRNVKVRFDRAMASNSWKDWFNDAHVSHLASTRSYHLPILLELRGRSW
jgi:exonuclease III